MTSPRTCQTAAVPNQPKTPVRSFRLPDELWSALKDIAAARGQSITDVLREMIEAYVAEAQREG